MKDSVLPAADGGRHPCKERDPRINPLPGDVLRKEYQGRLFDARGYIERQVDEVFAIPGRTARSSYMRVVYVGDAVCTPEVSLASWRKWARSAVVVKSAESSQETPAGVSPQANPKV